MATVEILTIPIGSQLTSTINKRTDPPELDSKNDFPVLLIFSENITGLTESDITLSAGSSLVTLEGKHAVWMATVRPPQTAGIVAVTVHRNAVSQGNPQTTKNIRVSTSFPDVDAETPTRLFSHGISNANGIAVTPTRVLIARTGIHIHKFTHTGIEQTSERFLMNENGGSQAQQVRLDVINGEIVVSFFHIISRAGRYRQSGNSFERVAQYNVGSHSGITHSRLGLVIYNQRTKVFTTIPYSETRGTHQDPLPIPSGFNYWAITHQDDLIYMVSPHHVSGGFGLSEIDADGTINFVKRLNIKHETTHDTFRDTRDISAYRDTLYIGGSSEVLTVDIRKYRRISKNTKTTIYPVILPYLPHQQTRTLDLSVYSPDAEKIIFDVGFSLPNWLSIDTQNRLQISTGTMQAGEVRTCLLKLRGINRIDSVEFSFYLVIEEQSPRWRFLDNFTMKANSSYDLFQLVSNATRIEVHPNDTLPSGARLNNGVFTVGTTGGQIGFRAFNDRTRQWADMDNATGVF